MIVQAIGLLDELDKEINTYAMRVREWYGWHFPEMAKVGVFDCSSHYSSFNSCGLFRIYLTNPGFANYGGQPQLSLQYMPIFGGGLKALRARVFACLLCACQIVNDNMMYAKLVVRMGVRTECKNCDFSDILEDDDVRRESCCHPLSPIPVNCWQYGIQHL